MGTIVTPRIEKISQDDVSFNSKLTDALFQKIAQSINAFCDFKDIICTEVTGSGSYTTKSNASVIILVGVGAGGGGGGGGLGSVLTYSGSTGTSADTTFYTIRDFGTRGYDGVGGTSTVFGGVTVASGGAGGKGGGRYILSTDGYPGATTRIYSTDETYVFFQKMRDSIKCMERNGYTINEVIAGKGGDGAFGTKSETTNNSPFTNTDTARGMDGYCGQNGNLGSACIEVSPGTTYAYSCGVGGSGGANGDTYTSNGITMSNASPVGSGENGALLIYELGV